MSFLKKLSLSLITLVLGSFIFVGILENYKSDESIKVKQLEDYYNPSREAVNACLKRQNELYLHYPNYGGSFRLLFDELKSLMKKPALKSSHQYGLLLEAYGKNLREVQSIQKELPIKVEECRSDVFLKLENLAIVTGSFDYFSLEAKKRAEHLNAIDKVFREKLKENNGEFKPEDLVLLMRKFGEIDHSSEEEWKKLILEFDVMLPMLENYSMILTEIEIEKYKVESNFFNSVRVEAAKHLNSRFEQGFFSWLI